MEMEELLDKPYVIGLDMGGTNSVFGIVDQRGTILAQTAIKTKAYPDVKDYVAAAVEALQPALDVVGGIEKVRGMGIGAPNGNFYNGTIEYAANLIWQGVVPIAELFEEALGVPCRVTNDANAAAMGEMTYGVARGMKNFIMITLGTGVGSGIVVDGHIVYGSDGFAGELGHFVVDHSEAWRPTARQRAWHVRRAKSSRAAMTPLPCENSTLKASPRLMCSKRQKRATSWPVRFLNLPVSSSAAVVPTLRRSTHRKRLSSSVAWPKRATTSWSPSVAPMTSMC